MAISYCTIEGLDGCGKDTQVDMLSGLGFTMLREPSERIRGDVQQEKYTNPVARSLQLLADRAEEYSKLEDDKHYLSNRSVVSGYGYTRKIKPSMYNALCHLVNAPTIDCVIFLRMTEELFIQRRDVKELDVIEKRAVKWHMKTQRRMLRFISFHRLNSLIIDADKPVKTIHENIIEFLDTEVK